MANPVRLIIRRRFSTLLRSVVLWSLVATGFWVSGIFFLVLSSDFFPDLLLTSFLALWFDPKLFGLTPFRSDVSAAFNRWCVDCFGEARTGA